MQIQITVTGGAGAAALFQAYADSIVPKVSGAVAQGGMLVETDAKAMAPVDTGLLRGSITSVPEGMTCEIGTNVEYGIYQEFGTYKMAAHPYLVPALVNNEEAILELIAAAISA